MGSLPDYEEAPGFLKVNKDLGWALGDELQEKCRRLVSTSSANLLIDITSASHVCSANMVILACAGAMSVQTGKSLKIAVSKRAARAFELAGFNEFISLHIV